LPEGDTATLVWPAARLGMLMVAAMAAYGLALRAFGVIDGVAALRARRQAPRDLRR